MVNSRHPKKVHDVKLAKNKTHSFQSASIVHPIFHVEDIMELIFDYLDIPSLKQCRLACSSWSPLATRLLMRRTFYNMSKAANDRAVSFCMKPSHSSIKVNGALLSRLSSMMRLRSSVSSHWKSISLSVVPSGKEISSFASFLTSISPSECPQLTKMQIHFEDDLQFKEAFAIHVPLFLKFRMLECPKCDAPDRRCLIPKFNPNVLFFNIRSLHLTLSGFTNYIEVVEFMKNVLRKNTVPQLNELFIELPDDYQPGIESDDIHASVTSAKIIGALSESTELRSLKVLKVQRKLPMRCSIVRYPKVKDYILCNAEAVTKSHISEIRLGLSNKLRELQWGSGYVLLPKENNAKLHSFFPGVLTTCVASALETLHLDGIYLPSGTPLKFPSVNFPHMPHLRKLMVEAVTIMSIHNFPAVFEKAPSVKEFSVKNSTNLGGWDITRGCMFDELIEFGKWEGTIGPGGYPPLTLLKLGIAMRSSSLQTLSKLFPNVEVFHFICDEWSRIASIISKYDYSEAELKLQTFKKIEEGLKNWKSLKQLKVTYLRYFSANGLLTHLHNCTAKVPGLRLYDFRQGDDPNSIPHSKDFGEKYLNEMKQKLFHLKTYLPFLFVLHNYKLQNQFNNNGDGGQRQHSMSSVMNELFKYAEKEGILNFRHSMK